MWDRIERLSRDVWPFQGSNGRRPAAAGPVTAATHRANPAPVWRRVAIALAILLSATGAIARADVPPPAWVSTLERDHPLVGKLWAADRRLFQPLDLLAREIVFEEFVLLGEVHDNPDHHRLRAWIIDAGSRVWRTPGRVRPPAAVFEHIRVDQMAVIQEFRDRPTAERTAATLLDRLDWARSGWPDRAHFEPLFGAVLSASLPLVAGDAPREQLRALARGEAGAPPAPEPKLGAALQDALLTELEASHCGLMPKTSFGRMADAQRYRDAHLAAQMARAAATSGGAILLAGNGHVRSDRGVPLHLRALAAGAKIVSVMLIEVERGQLDPAAYVPLDPEGRPAVDFVVFTPRTERSDPCEEMRRMMAPRKP